MKMQHAENLTAPIILSESIRKSSCKKAIICQDTSIQFLRQTLWKDKSWQWLSFLGPTITNFLAYWSFCLAICTRGEKTFKLWYVTSTYILQNANYRFKCTSSKIPPNTVLVSGNVISKLKCLLLIFVRIYCLKLW